jgi:uncharacterized membrane protein
MIRRWSHVIELSNDFLASFYFKKRFKFRIFRLSVRFKRFNLKKTKFKRKALIRLKHRANWYLYFNVIKTWTQDLKTNKNYFKYQYLNNILATGAVVFDPNYFKFRSEHYLYNFNGKISNISKKFYLYLHKFSFDYARSINLTFAWSEDAFDSSSNVIQLYSHGDLNFYNGNALAKKESVGFLNSLSFSLLLFKIVELRTFLNTLLFTIFANVKYFVFKINKF